MKLLFSINSLLLLVKTISCQKQWTFGPFVFSFLKSIDNFQRILLLVYFCLVSNDENDLMKNIFTELFKFSFTSTKECLFWICSGTFLMVLYSNKTLLFHRGIYLSWTSKNYFCFSIDFFRHWYLGFFESFCQISAKNSFIFFFHYSVNFFEFYGLS